MKSDHQIQAIVNGIISFLEEKKSLDLLPEVANELIKQSFFRVDPNLAVVSSPIKLSTTQTSSIKQILSQQFDRPIRIKTKIDKSIIAGLKIEVAGLVVDGTVNRKLQELKTNVIYD